MTPDPATDPRVGLTARPRHPAHELYGERGEVVAVYPDGAAGVACPEGVLVVRMESGRVLMAPAGEWEVR